MSENKKILEKEWEALNKLINALYDLEGSFRDCLSVCEDTNSNLYSWSELPKEIEVDKATEDCVNMLKYIRDKRSGLEIKQALIMEKIEAFDWI